MNHALAQPRMLARFQLLRELGRGAQATVWLAHDPRLDREVAVKLLSADANESTRKEWLNEARAVSRLKHPSIVPVFEADEHEGQPYLVFEFVDGPTLQAERRKRPAWPAREAVTMVLGVLDALAAAHEQGIVHRDLKPSNILLGDDGRARVMDFGIAARVAEPGRPAAGDGMVVGTPGYISPEAARGEAPLPCMDVFSAGVLLGELLAGAPLLRESDPYRAIARVQVEDLLLPSHVNVDETLRGIVHRALARQAAARYDSARSMHAALGQWLNPGATADHGPGSPAALEFLLRRMRHKTDFPAMSSSVVRIQRVAMSETDSVGKLSDEILKDVSLTNKLLRMVNTVHFTSVAGGGISTVSRAVALVGFAGIRNMALSVILLEHMGDKAHAALLREEFLRALMVGTLASDLTPMAKESEEAFLGAMFQNLGRLLTEYYFPEEALQIRQRIAGLPDTPLVRDTAARQILGLGLDDLGAGVAKAWGLPDTLQRALRMPVGVVPTRQVDRWADGGAERLRWLGRSANALTDAMLLPDLGLQAHTLQSVAEDYAPALGLEVRDMLVTVQGARTRLSHMAQAMGLHVAAHAPARRLLQTEVARQADVERTLPHGLATPTLPAAASAALPGLAHGLERVRQAVSNRSLPLNELLNLVLETVQRSLDMRRVVFCLRDPKTGQLLGRFGIGQDAPDTSAAFRITPASKAGSDLFSAVCAKGADLLIADAKTVAAKLPLWYRQRVNAPTFLLLPLLLKGAPIGLIYADKGAAGSIVLGEAELALLRGLRDQAIAAFSRGAA